MTDLFTAPTLPPTGETRADRRSRSGNGRDRKAARRRKRQRQARTFVVLLVALAVVGGVGYVILQQSGSLFGVGSPLAAKDYAGDEAGEQVQVEIPQGATGEAMGEALFDANVVASVAAFVDAYEANPNAQLIQSGTHVMLERMSAADAVALLAKNEKLELKMTIPEGFTVEQIVARAVEVTGLERAAFDAALADPASFGLPAEAGGKAEGWLAPSTYYVVPSDTPETLLAQMTERTVATLTERAVPQDQWQAVLTKASLVEREAKFEADRPKMARAIENRLERGMTLDIDASTAYSLGKPGTELTTEDNHDANNPYALYVHLGLPPTPIANPGTSSLDAVLNPEPGDWVFWVAVNLDTGETKFAETIQEHNSNVAELRAWEAANGG